MGQDWTFSIWFSVSDFQTLYEVYDLENDKLCFYFYETVRRGQTVVEFQLEMAIGVPFYYAAEGQSDLTGWSLEGQWNNLVMNYSSQYFDYDAVNDIYSFGMQIKMFMNEFDQTDVLTEQDDFWVGDNANFLHMVGTDASETFGCEGFIGDIIFGNYAYDE